MNAGTTFKKAAVILCYATDKLTNKFESLLVHKSIKSLILNETLKNYF